jgi:hypothetical protein
MVEAMAVKLLTTIDRLPEPVRRFMDQLSDEHKLLLVLKRELYDNDWRPMVADLNDRLSGKPYVLRLAHRIEDDLQRIRQMSTLERDHGIDLAEFLDLPDE